MASIRCPNCNFLNFATDPACKKCRQPIGNFAVETAAASAYGNGNLQTVNTGPAAFQYSQPPQQVQFPTYYAPPPPNFYDELGQVHAPPARNGAGFSANGTMIPPVCVKCGGDKRDLSMRNFKKDYTPPIAYIGVFGGILPLLILILVLRKRHKVNALFCPECWDKFKHYSLYSNLFGFVCLGALIGGLVMAVIVQRPALGLFAFFVSIGVGIFGKYYENKISPKYVKTNRSQIYIKIPNYGEVDFTHTN